MNIKKKLTSFLLTFAIMQSFGQGLSVQAATDELTTTSDSTAAQSSNSVPNPGIPETKPGVLNVISQYNTKSSNNTGDSNGAMAKGWINLNGALNYLKSSGPMATDWFNPGSDYYYSDLSTGRLFTNTTIDGYKIGSDGKRFAAVSKFKGIDISHHNGNIDFTKVRAAEIQVVYIKATEGTTFVDKNLEINYNGAKGAGLKTGFYHFLVGTSSPETQAHNFYNNIKDKQSDLKPVLDVETDGFDVMNYTLRFITEFKKLSNMDVCIYTYSDFVSKLDNRLAKYSLWEANYYRTSSNLPSNNIWSSRAGHQYTNNGVIDGISTEVDLNEFTQDIFR